jgi:hypothetical protein
MVLVGSMGVIEGSHRVPDAIAFYEKDNRVLNGMGAGPLNHDPHVARDTTPASPILGHRRE